MTTTELIKILQDNEKGGISHKPRNISLSINGRYMPNPRILLSSTGDGICGAEIDLDIEGDWFEEQPSEDVLDKIKAEINTPNRGTCDYFIVDRIEEIIDKYRKGDMECGR